MLEQIARHLEERGVLSQVACDATSGMAFAASFSSTAKNVLRLEILSPDSSRPIATAKMAADPEARSCLASAWRVLSELRRALPSCIVATLEPVLALIEEDGRCLLLSESRQGTSVLARTRALSARAAARRLHDDLSLFADWLSRFQASSAAPSRSSLTSAPAQAASRPLTTADADNLMTCAPARVDPPSVTERMDTHGQGSMCAGHGAIQLDSLHVADARPRVYDWEFSSLHTHALWDWYALWFSFAGRLRHLGSTPAECRHLLSIIGKHQTEALDRETTRSWLAQFLKAMVSREEAAHPGRGSGIWKRRLHRHEISGGITDEDILVEVLTDG